MAEEEAEEGGEEAGEQKKGLPIKLILIVVGVLALGGGGYFAYTNFFQDEAVEESAEGGAEEGEGKGVAVPITWIRADEGFPFDGDLPIDGEHLSPWVVEVVGNTPPTISVIKNDDGTVTIVFEGTLQTAPTVIGPWTDVDAISPLTISADQAQQFGRALR